MPSRQSRLRRDLRAILGDGLGFSVMVGCGETYLAAFALALGVSGVTAGLVASVPLLGGALLQLATPAGVERLGSHRRWVLVCVGVQAASFAPLVGAALAGRMPAWALYAVATLYWASGMAAGPAWNTWVGRLVPERLRADYWARRSRAGNVAVLAGLLVGGLLLQGSAAATLLPFAILFAVAGACRTISAVCIARQSEPADLPAPRRVSAREFLRRCRSGDDGRLLVFVLAAQAGVQVAGPYFTPYMLRELRLPYAEYMLLLVASFAAKITALPFLAHVARRHGARRTLLGATIGIVPLPGLWLVADALPWLVAVNFLSGIVWAAYELALFLLLFEAIRPEERTSVLTTYNLAHAAATLGGALAGGALLRAFGESSSAYALVFALSCVARAGAVLVLRRLSGLQGGALPILLRTLAVRPASGTLARPLLPGLPRRRSGRAMEAPVPDADADADAARVASGQR